MVSTLRVESAQALPPIVRGGSDGRSVVCRTAVPVDASLSPTGDGNL